MTYRVSRFGNKFGAVKQTYNGYSYMSKLEARYAMYLDSELRAGRIKGWDKQFKIEIRVNDKHICNYYCDFRVHGLDGSFTLVETKGYETAIWMLKVKLLEAVWLPEHLDHTYEVVK